MMLQTLLLWIHRTLDAINPFGDESHSGEEGQGLVEYALILVLVSMATLALLVIFGPTLANLFRNIVTTMQNVS